MLNAAYYDEASIIDVMGDIAHELAHEAWKSLGGDNERFVPDFSASALAHSSNEWKTDLLVIYKGFGAWLAAGREYAQRQGGKFAFTEQYLAMKPVEIRRRLRSALEAEGKDAIQRGDEIRRGAAAGDADALFALARQIWAYIVQEDPSYSPP